MAYATHLARDWNTRDVADGDVGYVIAFETPADFLRRYPIQGDASNQHNFLFASTTDFYNTHWKNAEYDDLIEKASGSPDEAAREKQYQQAEVLLMNEMPHMPIYHGRSFCVIKPNVQGIYHPAILGTVPRAKYVKITK